MSGITDEDCPPAHKSRSSEPVGPCMDESAPAESTRALTTFLPSGESTRSVQTKADQSQVIPT